MIAGQDEDKDLNPKTILYNIEVRLQFTWSINSISISCMLIGRFCWKETKLQVESPSP
jgi:hypothetical protein